MIQLKDEERFTAEEYLQIYKGALTVATCV